MYMYIYNYIYYNIFTYGFLSKENSLCKMNKFKLVVTFD